MFLIVFKFFLKLETNKNENYVSTLTMMDENLNFCIFLTRRVLSWSYTFNLI